MKNECWELIGMSRQRMGSVSASESATGTNTAITQSYSQTEPLFVAHEYVLRQVYQAIIDAALYIESSKPESTLSYITNEGESAFIQVSGSDLKLRDIKVFPTNRPEDTQMFNELRALAQPAMQNGASFYDVAMMWSTKSMREIKKHLRDIKEKNEALQQRALDQKDLELQNEREIASANLQQEQNFKQQEMVNDNYNKQLDRLSREKVALISAESKNASTDMDSNGVPDVLEISKMNNEQTRLSKEYETKLTELQLKAKESSDKLALEREKLQVARENQINDLAIAKENAKNRNKKK